MTLGEAFQLAIAHEQAGRVAEAEMLHRQIVAAVPQHADSWHRLGALALATGRAIEARDLLAHAVAIVPGRADYHSDLGVAAWMLRRADEASACFRRAIQLQPGMARAHCNLGDVLASAGDADGAIASYERALALQPGFAEAHNNLANALLMKGRLADATDHYRRAVEIRPDLAEALCNLGDTLAKLDRLDEGIEILRRATAVRPTFAEAHNNLGVALWRKGDIGEALPHYQRAIELRPDYAQAHCNLGSALFGLDRVDDAAACYEQARAIDPGCVDAIGNLGTVALRRGRFEESVRLYRGAIALSADFADAHWNLALALLTLGQYEEGWRELEWRWRTQKPPSIPRHFAAPQWDGSPMPGRTLLVHAEQGFGDTIQFFRYLPLIRERSQAAQILVECPPSLVRLLAHEASGDVTIISRPDWGSEHLPHFDLHVPMLSLPLVLRTYPPLAIAGPYLHAAKSGLFPEASSDEGARTLRVGLAWAGNPRHKEDRRRSIPLEKLAPLLGVEGVSFYNLQIEPPAPADIGLVDLTARIADFADTAELIAELDLIITVDTAAAHLAGALGRPVWLLLAFVPDWRWGLGREDTPWYPTMRIFRQPAIGDWDSVAQRVAGEMSRVRP